MCVCYMVFLFVFCSLMYLLFVHSEKIVLLFINLELRSV